MSYEKQTWKNGDVITEDKLNHMEDGIAGGSGGGSMLVVHDINGTLDKTWQEIKEAVLQDIPVVIFFTSSGFTYTFYVTEVITGEIDYTVLAIGTDGPSIKVSNYVTMESSGYPEYKIPVE